MANTRPDPSVPARFDDAQIQDDLSHLPADAADAYGIRHKPGRGRLTVYEIADRRLPEIVAEDLRNKGPDTPRAG